MDGFVNSKFIINENEKTLLDRFRELINPDSRTTEFFDVLVGYFRTSGFYRLQESLESVSKTRILIGINADRKTHELISTHKSGLFNSLSSKEIKQSISNQTMEEMENSENDLEIEKGVRKFLELLKEGQLEFKVYPHANIHAKVYICRFRKGHIDSGRVITGSSNFSASGFEDNLEFNVELKDSADIHFALQKFEELWEKSVDIKDEYINTIQTRTWFNEEITPYEIYLKFLYEYFKEDIDLDEIQQDVYLPKGFKNFEYQMQAVTSASRILDAYNGVFLADVVGLGKTFISALLAQKLVGRILVVCPPVLKEYWHDTFRDFGVRGFDIESHGRLDHVITKGVNYKYIIIDEAHRFRNELTQGYEKLHEICAGKKVVLVSATPINNKIEDIYSQLKLFQIPRRSTIPGVPDVEDYFSNLRKKFGRYKRSDPEYAEIEKEVSRDLRDQLLRHVMVRRTRIEIKNYFSEDMKFPEIGDPKRIVYKFKGDTYSTFYGTIGLLKKFTYSRYTPLLYLEEDLSTFEKQSQHNIGGFMKAILVKRLESSFHAFRKSVDRFITSYEKFIEMYQDGTVYISRNVDIYDYLEKDNEDELLDRVEKGDVQKYEAELFKREFSLHLEYDLKTLKKIRDLWTQATEDPKLDEFILNLETDPVLETNKLVVFTESKETGNYLYENLNRVFPGRIMFYSSHGAKYDRTRIKARDSRELIRENFDPDSTEKKDELKLLITTDVLAEGINLHESNTVINYDLPWNPTKVMQRVGRINRVGTRYQRLHIYNFFPTSQSDEHLGLEENIKSKIRMFHEILGGDAKYITEDEEPVTHELFGGRIYERLNDKENYEGEPEEESELKYLKILRDIRDNQPDLFERIKDLPCKARSALRSTEDADRLVTFLKKGSIKKFMITECESSEELSFFEAVNYFKCDPDMPKMQIPSKFYKFLESNKEKFDRVVCGSPVGKAKFRSNSSENYIIKRLKAQEMKAEQYLDDEDRKFAASVINAFEYGVIPKKTAQTLKRLIEKEPDPVKVIAILRKKTPETALKTIGSQDYISREKTRIVLSQYLYSRE